MRKPFKILTLLGIRPDYIRMFELIRLLDKGQKEHNYRHILVHSGQHYDPELFGVFLEELSIRKPDIDLEVGKTLKKLKKEGWVHQQALLSEQLQELFQKKMRPDAVIFLGDTNTVLSSVIVTRYNVPVIHIEAGGRSYDWRMPEEKNRIIIDHLSDALYCYLPRYREILVSEGVDDFRIKSVGNIIHDPLVKYHSDINSREILKHLGIKPKRFILVTIHREENISDKEILQNKLYDIDRFSKEKHIPIVFPLMPRTRAAIKKFRINSLIQNSRWITTKPLGFFDFTKLEKEARLIITDSGTVQEDGLIVGTPVVVARRSTERPETIWAGATILEGFEGKNTLYKKLLQAWNMDTNWDRTVLNPQGGSPSKRIYNDLVSKIKNGYFGKSRDPHRLKKNKFVKRAFDM